jgi:hypothetical protein
VLSVWLIVTGNSTKDVRIGALAGFWGLLVGGFAIFGRHLQQPAGTASSSGVVDVRGAGSVERPEDAAARLEFEYRLVQMLRREVQESMAAQMERMHEDVAALRNEIIEKVGGDLRMERIETTRIFGSDIEALQREIAALKGQRIVEPADVRPAEVRPDVRPAEVRSAEVWTVEVVEEAPLPRVAVAPEAPAAAPTPAAAFTAGMATWTVEDRPPSHEVAQAPAASTPAASTPAASTPFATAPAPPAPVSPAVAPPAPAPPAPAQPVWETPSYVARPPVQAAAPVGPRRAAEEARPSEQPTGGRRRREGEAAENNLLAQILQRESHESH